MGNRDSGDQGIDKENDEISPAILQIFRDALQMTFTDFDFNSGIKSNNFRKSSFKSAMDDISLKLEEFTSENGGNPQLIKNLRDNIENGMDLNQCQVFIFVPPFEITPLVENLLWSRNYFFLNIDNDKVCFLSCVMRRRGTGGINNPYSSFSDADDGYDGAYDSDNDGSHVSTSPLNTTQDSNYSDGSSDDN